MNCTRSLVPVLFLSAVWVVAPAEVQATNLVVNGGFEDPDIVDNQGLWQIFNSIPGWGVAFNYVELQHDGLFGGNTSNQAPEGDQWAELDLKASGLPTIIQELNTIASEDYQLTFSYSLRPGYGDQELAVFWNDVLVGTVGGPGNSVQNLQWRSASFDLPGSDGATLGFGSLANFAIPTDAGGNLIDNVSLVGRGTTSDCEVPEPSSIVLLGSTLFGGMLRRRRRARLD